MKIRSHPRAFTLIELLVVISIIALLVGILLPALAQARRTAREMKCLTQLRGFVTAGFAYQADEGRMPSVWNSQGTASNNRGGPIWSQRLILNGYLGDNRSLEIQRCPILAGDLPNFVSTHRGGISDTDGVYNYNMNSIIGGYEGRASTGTYNLVAYSTDEVREPSRTLLFSENYFPDSYLIGSGRAAAQIAVKGWMGIPHPQEDLNSTFVFRETMVSRRGTNNVGFADGSGRPVRGEQTSHNGTVFELSDEEFILSDPLINNP